MEEVELNRVVPASPALARAAPAAVDVGRAHLHRKRRTLSILATTKNENGSEFALNLKYGVCFHGKWG